MRGPPKKTDDKSPKGLQVKLKKWQSNQKESMADVGKEIIQSPEFKK